METEYSGKSPQSLVILVHGTGAGDLADRGSKWWQAGSEFWTVLTASVGPAAVVDRPFHWSGQNSESERKKAGRALLAHLFELESAGISYHIIGHSHGGSVVWHALVDSVRVNRRLFGLKSWATVGTPFLKFEPLRPHLCRWLALGILAALGAWLLSLAPFREWVLAISSLHESGGYLSLAFVGGFFAAISVLTVWALARVLVPIILCALTARERRAETRAAAWYGDRWLALWHPLDEPINSLAGTVGEAPQIAPRVAQDGIFGVVPLAGPIVNRLLARAADQFAWRLITSRIQGADRRAYTLVNVGRAPLVLQPGFEPIAPGLASEMTGAADAKSIESVKRLRELLENAYDVQGPKVVFDGAVGVVSFQEIIHTSYFNFPAINRMLADHILCQVPRPDAPERASTNGVSDGLPRRLNAVRFDRRSRLAARSSLELVMAGLLFIAPGVVLALGARAAFQSIVAPITIDFQIDQIAGSLNEARYLAAGHSAVIGDILLRLGALGRVRDPIAVVNHVPQGEPRRRAAMRLALSYGRMAQIAEVERLLRRAEPAPLYPAYAESIRTFAYVGYVDRYGPARNERFTSLADEFFREFMARKTPMDWGRLRLAQLLISRLEAANLSDRVNSILNFLKWNTGEPNGFRPLDVCEFVRMAAQSRVQRDTGERLAPLLDICPVEERRLSIIEYLKRGLVDRHDRSRLVEFYRTNNLSFLSASQIEQRVQQWADAGAKSGMLPSDPFVGVVPDLLALEPLLNEEIEADLGDLNSWPSRQARSRYFDFLKLVRTMQQFGAQRLAGIFARVANERVHTVSPETLKNLNPKSAEHEFERSMTEHVELIKVLTALGLSDLARKRADMMVAWTMRLEESQVSLKLYGYGAMAQAAKALGSSQLGSWAAEQALSIPLKDLDFAAAVSMLDVADGLSTLDMSLARRSLARAEQMVDIVSREPSRIVFQLQIAKLWSQFGDVRRARLAARKARSTSSEMEAYTEILDSVLARSQSTIARDLGIGSFKLPMEDDIRSILYPIGSTL